MLHIKDLTHHILIRNRAEFQELLQYLKANHYVWGDMQGHEKDAVSFPVILQIREPDNEICYQTECDLEALQIPSEVFPDLGRPTGMLFDVYKPADYSRLQKGDLLFDNQLFGTWKVIETRPNGAKLQSCSTTGKLTITATPHTTSLSFIKIDTQLMHALSRAYQTDQQHSRMTDQDLEGGDVAISKQAADQKLKEICEKYGIAYESGPRQSLTESAAYALGHAFDDLPPVSALKEQEEYMAMEQEKEEDDYERDFY